MRQSCLHLPLFPIVHAVIQRGLEYPPHFPDVGLLYRPLHVVALASQIPAHGCVLFGEFQVAVRELTEFVALALLKGCHAVTLAFAANTARANPIGVALRKLARPSPGGALWIRSSGGPRSARCGAGIENPPPAQIIVFLV